MLAADFEAKREVVFSELPIDDPVDLVYLWWQQNKSLTHSSQHTVTSEQFFGMPAYCLTVAGARKLVSRFPINAAIDNWMLKYYPDLNIRAVYEKDFLVSHIWGAE